MALPFIIGGTGERPRGVGDELQSPGGTMRRAETLSISVAECYCASDRALGAPLVAVDFGPPYHIDLWLTYHSEFKTSERHRIVIEWLRRIFDPKLYPCFRDEFIHSNDLVDMMGAQRESYGLDGFRADLPE